MTGTASWPPDHTASGCTLTVEERAHFTITVTGDPMVDVVEPPPPPPPTVRRTLETRVGLVFATETDSPGRTYSFTLWRPARP